MFLNSLISTDLLTTRSRSWQEQPVQPRGSDRQVGGTLMEVALGQQHIFSETPEGERTHSSQEEHPLRAPELSGGAVTCPGLCPLPAQTHRVEREEITLRSKLGV